MTLRQCILHALTLSEQDADNYLKTVSYQFKVPFTDLIDCFIDCAWAEIDGTDIEKRIDKFYQEYNLGEKE